MSRPVRKPKNLSLAPDAIERGELYSQTHGTSLSRLVSDFLRMLPLDDPAAAVLSPAVLRLRGVAASGASVDSAYREHLNRKYGER